MKSKPFSGILAGLLVSLAILSCGGSPPPAETPPPEPPAAQPAPPAGDPDLGPPDQAALDNLHKALSRADTSRGWARDIEAPGYFPPEWDAAEGQYAEAGNNPGNATLGDVKKTIALYEAAAETYGSLARKCLPLFYEDLSGEILRARDGAIDGGIRDISPSRLEAADQRIDRALEQYEAGNAAETDTAAAENYYAAASSAFDALDRYNALILGARSYLLGEEIEERGFADYDPENYESAGSSLDAAVAAYDGGDTETALAQAEEAFLRYILVMNEGWRGYTGGLKLTAETERRNALGAKANVAVKKDFDDADGLYTRGTAAYNAQDYAAAAEYYSQSIPLFSNAAKTAEQKRVIAEEAIQTAETRIGQSEETAREAEAVLQGGAQ
ncbi:MAG: hypothetical protein LBG14_07590 [Treponema sp.]|jgi:hypothetical protein|nr:hypothetical protein [Treponema sp.]